MSKDTLLKDLNIVIKDVNDKERTITAVGSKEVVDRDGDIVKVGGIDMKNYKKNPIVMLNHDYHDFPIGKAVGRKVWKESDKLMFKIQFATEEENPKADIAYKLYKGGYMNAFSIGFKPDFDKIEYVDQSKNKKDKGARRIFHEAELLEISAVSVPANQEALMAGMNKAFEDGVVDGEELCVWEELVEELTEKEEKELKTEDLDIISVEEEVKKQRTFEKETVDKLLLAATTIEDLTEALQDKVSELSDLHTYIEELELQVKEQELEEDEKLNELYDEYLSAQSPDKGADLEQMEDELIEEALNTLKGDNTNE